MAFGRIFGAAMLWACAAVAQDAQQIGLAEWRDMTRARVVTYTLEGALWGREFFHPDGRTATFVAADGRCMTGAWSWKAGVYCFFYETVSCFRHIRRDGALWAEPVSGGAEQKIARITPGALSCEPAVIG